MANEKSALQKVKTVFSDAEYKRFFQAAKTLEHHKISLKKTFFIVHHILAMIPDFDLVMASLFVHNSSIPSNITNRYLNEFQKSLQEKITAIIDPSLQLSEQKEALNHLLFEAFIKENRVLYYFLAHLLSQTKTTQTLSPAEKIQYAQLLFSIGAPLAYRMGLHEIKETLESMSFALLFKNEYSEIQRQRNEYIEKEHIILRRLVGKLRYLLKKHNIEFTIKNRVKNIYSIYRKLKKKGKMHLSALSDIFAVRVIVKDPLQCYIIMGLLHQHFPYIPGKIKDYISKPKSNAYQSLHTTVEVPLDDEIIPVEIQIRTQEMDYTASAGIAAHILYKQNQYGKNIENKKEMKKKMAELLTHFSENSFLQAAESDIFSQYIFVFGKDSTVKSLTKGATVLDFAYTVHTDIGNHITGALINGKQHGIETKLHNGDEVEICTSLVTQRSEKWIRIAHMPQVKKIIRSYYHQDT